MTQTPKRQMPAGYQLRVDGHLDDHWSPWFGDLTLTHEDDGTTSLSGAVSDQAELHGLLNKIRDLGITLISVAVVDTPDSVDHQPNSPDTREGGDPSQGRMATQSSSAGHLVAHPADTIS